MKRGEIQKVVGEIQYGKKGWSVRYLAFGWEKPYLQVCYDGTGEYGASPWTGRKWQLSEFMTPTEVVNTAFKAILAAEEHETRELFTFRGEQTHGPHDDIEQRVDMLKARKIRHDVRPDAMQGAT